MKTLHALSLGYAAAIVAAVLMLTLGILGNFGLYEGAVGMMQQWHMFFSLSVVGIVIGMVEAAIISFVILYAFAIVYNSLLPRS